MSINSNRFDLVIHLPIVPGYLDVTVVLPTGSYRPGNYRLRWDFEHEQFEDTPVKGILLEADEGAALDAAVLIHRGWKP